MLSRTREIQLRDNGSKAPSQLEQMLATLIATNDPNIVSDKDKAKYRKELKEIQQLWGLYDQVNAQIKSVSDQIEGITSTVNSRADKAAGYDAGRIWKWVPESLVDKGSRIMENGGVLEGLMRRREEDKQLETKILTLYNTIYAKDQNVETAKKTG